MAKTKILKAPLRTGMVLGQGHQYERKYDVDPLGINK